MKAKFLKGLGLGMTVSALLFNSEKTIAEQIDSAKDIVKNLTKKFIN